MQAEPEAIEAINKFHMFREFGWAETWRSFDLLPYSDYELIIACMNATAKREKMDAEKAQFISKEAALANF